MKFKYLFILFVIIFTCYFYVNRMNRVAVVGIKNDLIVYERNITVSNFERNFYHPTFFSKVISWIDFWPGKQVTTYGIMDQTKVYYQNVDDFYFTDNDLVIIKNHDLMIVSQKEPANIIKKYENVSKVTNFDDYQIYRLNDLNKDILIGYDGDIIELNESFDDYGLEPNDYYEPYLFHHGYAVVTKSEIKDGKKGVIDQSGNVLIEPQYDYLSEVSKEGLLVAKSGAQYDIINIKGEIIKSNINIDRIYDSKNYLYAYLTSQKLSINKTDHLYGLIDKDTNQFVVDQIYDNIESIKHENEIFYKVYKDNLVGVVNDNGDFVVPLEYKNVYMGIQPNCEYFFFAEAPQYQSIYDKDGNELLTGDIIYSRFIDSGTYRYYLWQPDHAIFEIKEDNNYGIVDIRGNKITDTIYDDVTLDRERALVRKDDTWYDVLYINSHFPEGKENIKFLTKDQTVIYSKNGYIYNDSSKDVIYQKYFIYKLDQFTDVLYPLLYGLLYGVIVSTFICKAWDYRQRRIKEMNELKNRLDL